MIKILPFLLIISLMIGCSRYNMQELRTTLEQGNYEGAFAYIDQNTPEDPKLPFLFERGLVAHYANRFAESGAAFAHAETIAEDLYTKSLLKEGASLFLNDQTRPYAGTQYERLLAHYYRALNYVYLNQLEGALVECRRATALINYFKDENEKYDFFGAAFLAHLSAMLFEASGEWNNAYISYRQAAEYYQNAVEKTGVQIPVDIGHSIVRLARRLGFADEFERYRDQYGEPPAYPSGTGELILFYESGYIPQKGEEALMFPILKTDKPRDEPEKFVPTLLGRAGKVYDDTVLQYVLRVAMPTIAPNPPHLVGVEVKVGQEQTSSVLVAHIEKIAIETFAAQRTTILFRTVLRALLKYLATSEVQKESKILGIAANIAAVATERADTRAWETLPNQIFMVRMPLSEGTHTLNLSFLDADGRGRGSQSVPDIKIDANRITFLNHRTYE
ncbi:MAG: hypothetical protein OXN27_25995 [Candidatus Poribacteria bacterium]|nr:hypothetical protein [Candidatus Poribacteria bacterium]